MRVIRDFFTFLNKNTTSVLMAKEIIGSQVEIRKFIQRVNSNLQAGSKYISFKVISRLWHDKEEPDMSKLFRIVLKRFLKIDYPLSLLGKKKNKIECLTICREILV